MNTTFEKLRTHDQMITDLADQLGQDASEFRSCRFEINKGVHGAHAVFLRKNDGHCIAVQVRPSEKAANMWSYSVSLVGGREICHGHILRGYVAALEDVLQTVISAFQGPSHGQNNNR